MKKISRRSLFAHVSAVAGLLLGMSGTAAASDLEKWQKDTRPVRIVVAFSPGGYTDVIGRILAVQLSGELKRSFIVENKPGANGVIGTVSVAQSAPDGNTLLVAAPGHVTNALIVPNVAYDPGRDFAPIAKVAALPNVLLVPPQSPHQSLQDILNAAKAKPGEVDYASGGVGSSNHLAMEMLAHMAGVKMRHIPYKGSSLAETDVAGGHVQMMFSGAGSAVTQVKGGKLRALAVTAKDRIQSLPDVPTVDEAGVKGYVFDSWLGFFAPAETPDAVVQALNAAVNKVMQSSEVVQRLDSLGVNTYEPNSVADFAGFLEEETKQQRTLVESFGDIKQ